MRADAADQRRNVVALRRQRLSFDEIGQELGFSRQRAHQLYRRAIAEIPAADVSQHRAEELELYDAAVRDLLLIARDHRMPRTAVEAWRAVLGFCERKARLLGLDAPVRTAAQLLVDDGVNHDIERLVAELLAMPAPAAAAALPALPAGDAPADPAPGRAPHRGPSRQLGSGIPDWGPGGIPGQRGLSVYRYDSSAWSSPPPSNC